MSFIENTHTTDSATSGRPPEGLREAPIRNPSRQKKAGQNLRESDQSLRESGQDLREARQDSRQTRQDLQQTGQDLRDTRQDLRESRQDSRQSGLDTRETDQNFLESGQALAESEERFRLLVESVTDYAIYMLDPEGRVVTWNAGAEYSKGYKPEEALRRNYSMVFLPEDAEAGLPAQELAAAAREGRFETQAWRLRKDGTRFWALVTLTAIRNPEGQLHGFANVTRDMTAQREHEERMQSSLKEKEVLLREVYHRVKNNLQVIQSLLKMRARLLPEGETRAAIDSTVQRIFAMSLAHEHLYRMEDLARLSLSEYLRDLFNGVEASNSAQPGQIGLQLDAEEILLNLDRAIPFGLLTNELFSNCFKHGFPEGRRGTVTLSIHRVDGVVRMVVSDDGIGLPEDFDQSKGASMGLKLAASLAHQLGGSLEFSSSEGCRVQVDLTRL
jgi:PAS domain S-box-containing protein